jgi:hypothetical protein
VRLEKEIERRVKREFPAILSLKTHVRHWPDQIFFLPGGKVIFMEFKQKGKKPREGQRACHMRLLEQGFDAWVVDSVERGIEILEEELLDGQ